MPDEATWDTASVETAEPAAAVDPPVADPEPAPPAETAPLEETVAPQLEADVETAREGESQPEPEKEPTDDYVPDADDPPEIAALSTPAAKRWAKRQYQEARPMHTFLDLDAPIQSFGDELYKRSESRYFEHVDDILKYHKDYIVSDPKFGAKYIEELQSLLPQQSRPQPNEPAQTTPAPSGTSALSDEELDKMSNEQIAQRFQEAQATAAAEAEQRLRAEFDTKFNELKSQLDATTNEQTTEKQKAFQSRVAQETNKLYDTVWTSVVDGGIREIGLEVKPDDPPKIANLKNAAARILKAETEPTFDSDDANKKLVAQVVRWAQRGEFANAWREQDNLTVRARAAFATVLESPEVKELRAEIEAYANNSKANPRAANPAPPAPGSSTGVTIKSPTTWDEAERMTAA